MTVGGKPGGSAKQTLYVYGTVVRHKERDGNLIEVRIAQRSIPNGQELSVLTSRCYAAWLTVGAEVSIRLRIKQPARVRAEEARGIEA